MLWVKSRLALTTKIEFSNNLRYEEGDKNILRVQHTEHVECSEFQKSRFGIISGGKKFNYIAEKPRPSPQIHLLALKVDARWGNDGSKDQVSALS